MNSRIYGPKPANHPTVGKPCHLCGTAFVPGVLTTLQEVGPPEGSKVPCQEIHLDCQIASTLRNALWRILKESNETGIVREAYQALKAVHPEEASSLRIALESKPKGSVAPLTAEGEDARAQADAEAASLAAWSGNPQETEE